MGYTHYWRKTRGMTHTEWASICSEARCIFAIPAVAEVLDQADFDMDGESIRFNGIGENAYETFVLERMFGPSDSGGGFHKSGPKEDFNFCKTAVKPYDAVVCAVLAIAAKWCAALRVTSDGDWNDWAAGFELCAMVRVVLPNPVVKRMHSSICPDHGKASWPTLSRVVRDGDTLSAFIVGKVYAPPGQPHTLPRDKFPKRKRLTKRGMVALAQSWIERAATLAGSHADENEKQAQQLRECADELKALL